MCGLLSQMRAANTYTTVYETPVCVDAFSSYREKRKEGWRSGGKCSKIDYFISVHLMSKLVTPLIFHRFQCGLLRRVYKEEPRRGISQFLRSSEICDRH